MPVLSNRDAAVLVLGASRGLGRGIAEALARIGFTVGVGCRKPEDAEDVSGAIRASHGRAVPIVVDVTRSDTVEAAVGAVRGAASRFAGLVNNAGVIHPIGHIADTDPTLWVEALHANLLGPYLGARAALPHLDAGGVIVNVSSGAASNPMEGWGAYCCTKAGLAMLTRMIDHEYRAKGIHAYGFRPGVVDTDMQGDIRASGINPVSKLSRSDLVPVTVPAEAVAWLFAERPADLSGQEVDVRNPAIRERIEAARAKAGCGAGG